MRPQSAYGRGTKVLSIVQDNVFNSKIKPLRNSNNPVLGGKGILTDEQIEQQLNICRQNDVEVLKAQMNLKLDVNQKKSEETKKIIINGYEEQYKMIYEMNEKKMETFRLEQERFTEKLLSKQKQEIKELEISYEGRIKVLKQQLDDSKMEGIRKQEEMLNLLAKEQDKLVKKQEKKVEEIKQKQKQKLKSKIEQLKLEWLEGQEEQKGKIQKECEKTVQKELIEMTEQINNLKESVNLQQKQLMQKDTDISELTSQIKLLQQQNESYIQQLNNRITNTQQQQLQQQKQKQQKQQQLQQLSEQPKKKNNNNLKQIPSIEEKDEDLNHTDYKFRDEEIKEIIHQQDISKNYNFDIQNNNNNINEDNKNKLDEDQDLIDLQQLQSDIKQSIQYQIHLLHSRSQQTPDQSNQKTQSLSPSRNRYQNSIENISLKIDQNESIKLQSEDIYKQADKMQLMLGFENKFDQLENISLNNSRDFVLDGNSPTIENNSSQNPFTQEKSVNTSFRYQNDDESYSKQNECIIKLKNEIEQQREQINLKQAEFNKVKETITTEFNIQMKQILQSIKEKQSKQTSIIKIYELEIQKLMSKIQNLTDVSNSQVLPAPQLIKQSNQDTQIIQQLPNVNGNKQKTVLNKSEQKKNELMNSPQFTVPQKLVAQKPSIIIRNSQKTSNSIQEQQRPTQQSALPIKQTKI